MEYWLSAPEQAGRLGAAAAGPRPLELLHGDAKPCLPRESGGRGWAGWALSAQLLTSAQSVPGTGLCLLVFRSRGRWPREGEGSSHFAEFSHRLTGNCEELRLMVSYKLERLILIP